MTEIIQRVIPSKEKVGYSQAVIHPAYPRLIPGITLNFLALDLPLPFPITRPPNVKKWILDGRNLGIVGQVIRTLPVDVVKILDLREIQGYPYKEIGKLLNMTESGASGKVSIYKNTFNHIYGEVLRGGILSSPIVPKRNNNLEGNSLKTTLGETVAFDAMYEEYQERIYNCIYRLMGNREEAHDLTQEAFLRAYVALPKVKRELKMGPWLYRIATNLCFDHLTRRRVIHWEPLDEVPSVLHPKNVAKDDPEREILRLEERERVHRVLEKLPPKYRAALVLREYQDMSCEEIAEVLGTSRSSVKSLLYRSREEFRQVYTKLENTPGSVPTAQPVHA